MEKGLSQRSFAALVLAVLLIGIASGAAWFSYSSWRRKQSQAEALKVLEALVPQLLASGALQPATREFRIVTRHGGIPYTIGLPIEGTFVVRYLVDFRRNPDRPREWRFTDLKSREKFYVPYDEAGVRD